MAEQLTAFWAIQVSNLEHETASGLQTLSLAGSTTDVAAIIATNNSKHCAKVLGFTASVSGIFTETSLTE